MFHHQPVDVPLTPQPLGAGYTGPGTYRDASGFATSDGALSAGMWAYAGRLVSANPGTAHQVWVVISGRITVEIDGQSAEAGPGDIVAFEAPYPAKTVTCTDDFRAVWIAVQSKENP